MIGKLNYVSISFTRDEELLLRYCNKPTIMGDIELIERCIMQAKKFPKYFKLTQLSIHSK